MRVFLPTATTLLAPIAVHLFLLARQHGPPTHDAARASVSPMLQRFLDQQGQSPAVATDVRWNVVAWNTAACVVFGDYGQMTSRERNTVWRLFTTPAYRQIFVDREGYARRVLAQFRARSSHFFGDPQMTDLIHDLLRCSPEFRAWWSDHEVLTSAEEHKALIHPHAGVLRFDRLTFLVSDAPDLTVTVYLPAAQTDTAQKLAQLLDHDLREQRYAR